MRYALSQDTVAKLKEVISINLKTDGLSVWNSSSKLLEKFDGASEPLYVTLEADDLKMVDGFLDGALRGQGIQALKLVADIIKDFKHSEIKEEEISKDSTEE